jgi:hypothetical protein
MFHATLFILTRQTQATEMHNISPSFMKTTDSFTTWFKKIPCLQHTEPPTNNSHKPQDGNGG